MTAMESTRPATARVRLARLAERVVDADDRVSATAGAGRWLTRDGDRAIAGVVAAETVAGAVELQLHLIVEEPSAPLEQLAGLLRQAIVAAAIRSDLAGRLGAIDISFDDLAPPAGTEGAP